jgi:adenine-specific DNA-methyltransferase
MSLNTMLKLDDQGDFFRGADEQESKEFLSEQLITYIGNKRKLLPLIEKAISISAKSLGKERISFADVFAGTGVVSRMARRWSTDMYINDFEEYSSYTNTVYQANICDICVDEVDHWRAFVNKTSIDDPLPGFITELYSPKDESNIKSDDRVFYSRRNAMFLDTARREIDKVPEHVKPFLLAPLIQRASVHVNTSGVFKGFYKNKSGVGQFGGTMKNALQRIMSPIEIPFPVLSRFKRKVTVSQLDAIEFVSGLPNIDVAYLDPPYNQHPYGSNYFMLNLILRNERPKDISRVSGIPKIWQRSPYNVKSEAASTLEKVVDFCPAKVILISYNSEGFISPEEMLTILESKGRVEVFDQVHNTFRGCRNLSGRSTHVVEKLFKLEKKGG